MCGITLHGGAGVHVGAGVRTQAQARMCAGARIPHIPHIPHTPYESTTYVIRHTAQHTAHTAHPYLSTHFLKKMTADTPEKMAERVIRCTPDNAAEFRDLISRWPELNDLVRSLQAQGLFPGLRAMQIRLTGGDEWVGKGVAAIQPQNAPVAPQTQKD